jgi:hypothetical protein
MERALADLDAARAVLQERMHALRELAEDVQNLEEAR